MKLAITLAEKAKNPSPNPKVGCVIIKNGKIIAEGFHEKAGKPHAEIIALKKAGKRAQDATLFVTLEPCTHHGKTPPCAQAIVKAGIKKVVIGMRDPNPKARGGVEFLRKHGIEVETDVLEKECEAINQIWLKNIRHRLPYLTLKLALDQHGSSIPSEGKKWITGTASRRAVMRLRREHDAILVGAKTIIADNPRLTIRGLKVEKQPLRIVLGKKKNIPKDATILQDGEETLVTDTLSLKKLFQQGITSIFVEGGETTAKKLLDQNLIDRVLIFQNCHSREACPRPRSGSGKPEICGKKLPLKKIKTFGNDTLFEAFLKSYL